MRGADKKAETDMVTDGLQCYRAKLKPPANGGLRRAFWKIAGSALALLTMLPFMSGTAKASVRPLGLSAADNPAALQNISAGKYHGIQVAGHTDVPHTDSNPHGDHTDPWGTHIDVSDHVDSAHVDQTSDDSGGDG